MQRFLLDANQLIPLEPTSPSDLEAGTPIAADIVRRANELGIQILVHPETIRELRKDPDPERRSARQTLLTKYQTLSDPPGIEVVEPVLGRVELRSNDWFDHLLLAAVHADAVHHLITDDERMRRKARRLGIAEDRILTASDARAFLETLVDHPQAPPPQVQARKLYSLKLDDPIFESLRVDYPGFDEWFAKASREGRSAWIIEQSGSYAGICIWKTRDDEYGLGGKVMKISTFKVAEEHRGRRYGELLLKAPFSELHANHYDNVWLTAFDRHDALLTMLEDFGFYALPDTMTELSELVYVKRLTPTGEQVIDPFAYHQRFGPPALDFSLSPVFVIPIQPRYHRRLFPDDLTERMLMPGNEPFGNAIRKAYLSRSQIEPPPRGAIVLFYRSEDQRAVTAIGIVEKTMRSNDASEIAKFAGQRTVYSYNEIAELARSPVLTILFRQDRLLPIPWRLETLIGAGVLAAAPQSITQVRNEEAIRWLSDQLAASP